MESADNVVGPSENATAKPNPLRCNIKTKIASMTGTPYALPEVRPGHAGSVICLARQEWPDTSAYNDPDIVYRLQRYHHAGLIVQSDLAERVEDLLDTYGRRFLEDFCAVEPPPASPTA